MKSRPSSRRETRGRRLSRILLGLPRALGILVLAAIAALVPSPQLQAQGLMKSWASLRSFEDEERIERVSFSKNGKIALLATRKGELRVVDVEQKKTVFRFGGLAGRIEAMAVTGDGKTGLFAIGKALWSASLTPPENLRKVWEGRDSISAIDCAGNHPLAALATSGGLVVVNAQSGEMVTTNRQDPCLAVHFSPDGQRLAAGLGKRILIYEVPAMALLQTWPNHFFVESLAFAPSGQFIAVGGDSNSLVLKRVSDGQTQKSLNLGWGMSRVSHLAFGPDQASLFAAGDNRLVVFEDLNPTQPEGKPIKLEEKVHSLAYSRASEALFAGTQNLKAVLQWTIKPPVVQVDPPARFTTRIEPPLLTVLEPANGTRFRDPVIGLSFKVKTLQDQPVTQVRILVDGRPAKVQVPGGAAGMQTFNGSVPGNLVTQDREFRCSLQLPEHDSTVVVLAENALASSDPAVVKLRWEVLETPALPPAIRVVAPVLSILSPANESEVAATELGLQFKVKSVPGQPVNRVKVLVDGVPVSGSLIHGDSGKSLATAEALRDGDSYRFPIRIPERDATVVVMAETAYANSNAEVLKLRWKAREVAFTPVRPVLPSRLEVLEPRDGSAFRDPVQKLRIRFSGEGGRAATGLRVFVDGRSEEVGDLLRGSLDSKGFLPQDQVVTLSVQLPRRDCSILVMPLLGTASGDPAIVHLRYQDTTLAPIPPVPPKVRILSPDSDSPLDPGMTMISFRVDALPGQEASGVKVLLDGVPAAIEPVGGWSSEGRGKLPSGQALAFRILLPARDSSLVLMASNQAGAGEPAGLRLRYKAPLLPVQVPLLPPVVRILAPAPNEGFKGTEVALRLQVEGDPKSGPNRIRVFVDDVAVPLPSSHVAEAAGGMPVGQPVALRIPVPERDCTVFVVATNAAGASEPARLRLRYLTPALPPPVPLLPPKVQILSPRADTLFEAGELTVTFQVDTAPGQEATGLRLLVDGVPTAIAAVGGWRPDAAAKIPGGRALAFKVPMPARDSSLVLVASNLAGAGDPVGVRVKYNAPPLPPPAPRVPPTLRILEPGTEASFKDPGFLLKLQIEDSKDPDPVKLRVYLDGSPIQLAESLPLTARGGVPTGQPLPLRLNLPKRDCTVLVVASNAAGTSEPVTVRLRFLAPAPPEPPKPPPILPPKIDILSPAGPSAFRIPETTVVLRVQPGSGSDRPLPQLLVDGAAVPTAPRALPQDPKDPPGSVRYEYRVVLPRQDCTLLATASAPQGNSAPAVVRMRWDLPVPPPVEMPAPRKTFQVVKPTLTILKPSADTTFTGSEIRVSLRIGSAPEQEVTKLQIYVDGFPKDLQPMGGMPAQLPNGRTVDYKVPVPPRDCQIMVQAENAYSSNISSVLRLRYQPPAGALPTPVRPVLPPVPPTVIILEPAPNTLMDKEQVLVKVKLTYSADQPVTEVRLLVNGQESRATRAPVADLATRKPQEAAVKAGGIREEIQYFSLSVPSKDCTVMAVAEARGTTSDPAFLKLRWKHVLPAAPRPALPSLYILAVGISHYKEPALRLEFPAKDAADFAAVMQKQEGKIFQKVAIRLLTSEKASRDSVEEGFEWITKQATDKDVTMVFLAGHGENEPSTNNYFFLPYNAVPGSHFRTMVSGAFIRSILASLPGKRILLLDTCFGGNVTGGPSFRGLPNVEQFARELKTSGQGLVVVTSSQQGQKSQEHPKWNNGAFTKALVEGLGGKAEKDKDGYVTLTAIDHYITKRVKELTGGTQAPTTQKGTDISDFPLSHVE